MTRTLASVLATTLAAFQNRMEAHRKAQPGSADEENAKHWCDVHSDTIDQLVKDYMPSGSGWDCGTKLDYDASRPERLLFHGSYHHMNDVGMYDGWTDHTISCRASLVYGLDIRIGGRDRNQIKDYLAELFESCLSLEMVSVLGRGWVSAERLARESKTPAETA